MKKIISVFLSLVLLFSFSACSNKIEEEGNKPEDDATVVVSDCYNLAFYESMTKHNIIENGVAKYYILLPENPSGILEFAAEDVNYFLSLATGVQLPIVREGDSLPLGINNYISIGKTDAFSKLNIDPKFNELSTDGYRIYVRDNNFYSISNVDRGALYGCYDLLKRYINLRFLNSSTSYYLKSNTVWFAEYEYEMVPEFEQRSFLGGNLDENWQIRTTQYGEFSSRVVDGPWAGELGNIHTITDYYVKPSQWQDSHPEFFSSYTNSAVYEEDVCWSNGITDDGKLDTSMEISVAKIVIDTIINNLKEHPENQYFMLGIADQWDAYCKCDKCKEREQLLGEKSGITTMFSNVIAEEVNKWAKSAAADAYDINHDIYIIQFAYYWTLNPPVHFENGKWEVNHPLAKPNEYICIRYAPLNANFAFGLGDEKQTQSYKNVVAGWSAICDKLMIYDYVERLDMFTMYLPHLANISSNARYLKENNFIYWMVESVYLTGGLWHYNLVEYIVQRLWWDVDADVQSIINEYIELYNGNIAAPYIKQFIELMEDNLAKMREQQGLISDVFNLPDLTVENYSKALLEQSITLLNQAQSEIYKNNSYTSAEKEMYTNRLAEVKLIPEGMLLYNYDLYYWNDTAGKIKLATNYYNHAQTVGLKYYTIKNGSPIPIKEYYESIVNG